MNGSCECPELPEFGARHRDCSSLTPQEQVTGMKLGGMLRSYVTGPHSGRVLALSPSRNTRPKHATRPAGWEERGVRRAAAPDAGKHRAQLRQLPAQGENRAERGPKHPEVSSVLSSSPGFSAVGRFSLCGARALTSGHLSFLVPPCELVPSFLLAQPVRSAAELCVLDAAL